MKKILLSILIIVVLIIALAVAIPFLFKDKIIAKAKTEINNNINAKVNFSDIGVTIFHSFPNLTLCMNDLSVVGINEFDGDTLMFIRSLDVTVNIWNVMSGSQMEVRSVSLDQPLVNILILENGKANYDITKPADSSGTASSSSSFKVALKSYAINNGTIRYDDRMMGFKMLLANVNHSGKGDFTQDLFTLDTKTEIDKTSVWYGGMKYLSNAKANLTAVIDMDMKNYKYTFKENELQLNELVLGFDGWLAMPTDDITMDIKWNIRKNDFRNFISMVPGVYSADFKNVKSSGKLELNGFVKGTYNEKQLPAYMVNLKIEQGMFQYPSLPSSVNNVNVDLNVSNPDGVPDHTVIDLKQMHAEIANAPIDARLHVTTPVSDANIDAMLKGQMDLKNIKNIVPLEKGTDLNGLVAADLTAKGRYSSIEKKEYENFNAAGTFSITGMNYKSEGFPATVVQQMMLTFNPRNVTLNTLDLRIGASDIAANGSVDNLLGYYFKDELLKGNFNFSSSLIDLNEMMTGSSTTAASDTAKMIVLEIPANIDFTFNSEVKKILYEDKVVENLKGTFTMSGQELTMQQLVFNMLNGTVTMSGKYATTNPVKPDFSYVLSLKQFDLQQSFKTFLTIQKMAPIAERCTGNFSTDLDIRGNLDQHMQPVMNSLTGSGRLTSDKVVINNFEPLNKIADALKMEQYKKAEVENVNFSYEFENGRIKIKPYQTKIAGTDALIDGSSGFDQTIDYKIGFSIPKEKLGTQASSVMTGLVSKANGIAGTSFSLPDPIKINVLVGGTISKPTIKTGFGDQGKSVVDAVKDEVKEQVEAKVEDVKQSARDEAAKIMADAQVEAQKIRDAAKAASDKAKAEGYAAADKLVSQVTNPLAKVAAQEAAKKSKSETDKQAQKIIDEGNKQAQAVLDAAKKKSDELLK